MMRRSFPDVTVQEIGMNCQSREKTMWWGIGAGAILYFVVAFTLGLMSLRNGHGWMFFFGIFFPVLWIFGAFMRPSRAQVA
jgi:hypothetical protein